MDTAIAQAGRIIGGPTKMAQRLGVLTGRPLTSQAVSNWFRTGRVSAAWAIPIETLTEGKITRNQLRPDLYP
jgi:DNA-binding transcriptional regulator YdaS (Cro superfamily)